MERSSKLLLPVDMPARIQILIEQVELRFWYFSITLMDESPLASFFIQETYRLITETNWHKLIRRSMVSLSTGTALGILLGAAVRLF
jgi:hypothetical protein